MAELTPIERIVRWAFERPRRCHVCKTVVPAGVRFCSDECEFEHVSSIP